MLRKNIFKNTSNLAPFLQKLSLTMNSQEFQTLLPRQGSDLVDVSFRDQIVSIVYSEIPFRTPADFPTASGPAGHTILNTVPVTFLSEAEKLPGGFIQGLPLGSKEFFATQANLRYF